MSEEAGGRTARRAFTPPVSRLTRHGIRLVPPLASCSALGIVFLGLRHLDMSIVRYVRSVTVHLPWDQLTVPWMAFVSDSGDWIGKGEQLVGVSAGLLAAGWMLSKTALTRAGVETLVAHGLAALIANGLKHLVGRPRPKFAHSGEWHVAPSWTSGLDSFPSGHTTATCAVATVLARRFPWSAPLCVAVVLFVGVSRVLRGSHFPTDVVGGAVIGLLSGSLASEPWKAWRHALVQGLRHAAIGATLLFGVLWVLAKPADDGLSGTLLTAAGLLFMAVGLWIKWSTWSEREVGPTPLREKMSSALVAYGLAAMTTAPLIVAAAGFACLGFVLGATERSSELPTASRTRRLAGDAVLVAGVVVGVLILLEGRAVLPFR